MADVAQQNVAVHILQQGVARHHAEQIADIGVIRADAMFGQVDGGLVLAEKSLAGLV